MKNIEKMYVICYTLIVYVILKKTRRNKYEIQM